MATNVGTIEYDAIINTDGLDSGASKVTSVIGGIGKVAAAAVAAGAVATGALVAGSVKAFAEYEQLVGGVDTLFKESSGTVQAYAQNAFRTAGLSANEYMSTVTSFSASLLQGLGGDTAKAASIADMAVRDMSDNANKFGTDMTMIQNAYQGFAKDNFTMLDNLKLGYGGTASEMARLVNESGVMGASFQATAENVKDIPFDQLLLAINKVQTEMGITGTTAEEASKTISGAFNATKASWENVLTAFGTGNNEMIKAAIDGLVQSAMNLVNNISVIIPNVLAGIGQLVTAFAAQLPTILQQVIPALTNFLVTAVNVIATSGPQFIAAIIQAIVAMTQALAAKLPEMIPPFIAGIKSLLNVIVTNLPLFIQAAIDIIVALVTGIAKEAPTLIPQIIDGIMKMLDALLKQLPLLIQAGIQLLVAVVQGLAKALPILISYLPEIINTIVSILTQPAMIRLLMKAAWDIMWAVTVGIIKSIPELLGGLAQVTGAILKGFASIVGSLFGIGWDLVKGLWNGINDAKGWVLDKIKGFGTAVLNGIKSFFGIKSPSTLFRDEIGKNLALGVGEGFQDGMGDVVKDMQNAIPTPSVNIDSIGEYQAVQAPTTVVVKLGEETIATRVIDLINDRTRLSGNNAILV